MKAEEARRLVAINTQEAHFAAATLEDNILESAERGLYTASVRGWRTFDSKERKWIKNHFRKDGYRLSIYDNIFSVSWHKPQSIFLRIYYKLID